MNVLVIEDDKIDANELNRAISLIDDAVWKMTHVDRVGKAIKALERKHYDCILLDLFLPDSQGLKTLKKLKEHSKTTPIVIMSEIEYGPHKSRAEELGACDYLLKGQITEKRLRKSLQTAVE